MMRSFGCAQVKIGSYKKCTYIKLVGDKLSNLREIAGEKDIRSRIRLHSASAAQTFFMTCSIHIHVVHFFYYK